MSFKIICSCGEVFEIHDSDTWFGEAMSITIEEGNVKLYCAVCTNEIEWEPPAE